MRLIRHFALSGSLNAISDEFIAFTNNIPCGTITNVWGVRIGLGLK